MSALDVLVATAWVVVEFAWAALVVMLGTFCILGTYKLLVTLWRATWRVR